MLRGCTIQKERYSMPKLSKSNKYAIQWLNSQNLSIEEISEELKININQVSKELNTANVNKPEANSGAAISRSKQLMINQTASKKSNSVAIMTGEASMLNDSMKNTAHNSVQKNTDHYIFRPNS